MEGFQCELCGSRCKSLSSAMSMYCAYTVVIGREGGRVRSGTNFTVLEGTVKYTKILSSTPHS